MKLFNYTNFLLLKHKKREKAIICLFTEREILGIFQIGKAIISSSRFLASDCLIFRLASTNPPTNT